MITTSHPGEWDALGVSSSAVSHRATTSSRLPGKTLEGSVRIELTGIAPCVDCGTMRHVSRWPHAPRWLAGRLVDCVGRAVTSAVTPTP